MGKSVTQVLAENLHRFIGEGKRLPSQDAAERASGVTQSTIQRAMKAETQLRVDNLARLAKAVGVEAWQLLVPDLKPECAPELRPPYGAGELSTPPMRDSLLPSAIADRIERLDPGERREVEAAIVAALSVIEGRRQVPGIAGQVLAKDPSTLTSTPKKRSAKSGGP